MTRLNYAAPEAFHEDEKFCSADCRHADINRLLTQLITYQDNRKEPHYP